MTTPTPTPTSGAADLPEALRVPLDSLHADAGYLCGRLLNGSLTQEQVVESIRRRIDAAKLAALTAQAISKAPDHIAEVGNMVAQAISAEPAAHVQNPAENEHVADDMSKNGAEMNMSTQQQECGNTPYDEGPIALAQPVAPRGAADGFFLLLPQRPKPEAPAGTAGLDWDAYSGAQMLAFGRDCSDAAIAALRTQQTAPAGACYEKELEDALRERDEADDFIDTLLDEVLGADRAEWSSAYGRADALEEVCECITALHKPAVDRAWKQFEAATKQVGDVVAYLDVGAGGYLDLEAALSDEAMQQLPKGRHALVIAGTYGIDGYVAAPQPSPTAQAAESVPAIQGEMNVQLDIDSSHSAPGQQRDVARSVALGQPVGNGQDQAAGHLGAQGDKLLTVAERNIRSFLRSATFKSESDREAALNCVDILWEAARAAESVPAVGYPPLPDFDSGDEPIWEAIFNWKAATPGSDAHRKANAIESAIINQLRAYVDAYVDADRAARAPADSVLEDAARDHIRALIAQHADILEQNESAYFELCYHRATGWMAWITDKPLCMPPVINPGRTVLAQGQGDTPDEACADAARKQRGAT